MRRVLCILGIVIGVLVVLGLSIWIGFPAIQGFDRTPICGVGYFFGVGLIVVAAAFLLDETCR